MATEDNNVLIVHQNCDQIVAEINANLTELNKTIVWRHWSQNETHVMVSDEELCHFGSIVLIGFSLTFVKEFNRRVRTNGSNDGLKIFLADICQTFVYLFTDFGPNVRHITFDDYLKTIEVNISDKINTNIDRSISFTPLVSIISGLICGQLLGSEKSSENQLFYYELDPQIVGYKFGTVRPIVVIGLGSLGFSIVKQLVRIGAKNLVLIDSDSVHKYNVRHNSFHGCDVGLKKCEVIKRSVVESNKEVMIETFVLKVHELDSDFYEGISSRKGVIVSAVDNTEAKRFINKVSLNHSLPLIDVGIDGHMFHMQSIVPHLTESYFTYSDPSDSDYPLCAIKSFPHSIEHCIEWSKTKFDNWLNKKPKRAHNWIQCLHISRLIFEKFFNEKAKQLLFSIPLDHMTESDEEFWADKQTPKPIEFDVNNDLHKRFLISCAQLIANVNNIEEPQHMDISEALKSLTIPSFVPKSDKIIITDSSIKQIQNEASKEVKANTDSLRHQIYSRDNDKHMEFVFASANCRALMYGIECISMDTIDRIHNKLIHCFSSTLSTASAKVSIEIIKLFQLNSDYREQEVIENDNYFYNLSNLSTIVVSKPVRPLRTTLSDLYSFTEWDHWVFNESRHMSTLEDLLNELCVRSGANCTTVILDGTKSVYFPQLFPHHLKRKKQTIRDIVCNYYKTIPSFVMFNVSFETHETEDICGPNVKYVFEEQDIHF